MMQQSKASAGFTLIELMIVVAIVGILAAVVYPVYVDQVRSARRAEAKSLLQDAMKREQDFHTVNSQYTTTYASIGYSSTPVRSRTGWYQLSISNCSGDCIQLTATARNDQQNDDCGNFTLDSRGVRSVTGSGDCW